MTYRKPFALLLCAAFALVGALAYRVGRARADGAPTVMPLTYGGVLDNGGVPVEGTRNVTVRLWDAATAGTAACTTVSPTTPFSAGRFRVTMDAACAVAVAANPNLWAEIIVDSTTFPRTKVGAVPYALEAARAAGASGALASRLAAVETAARPRQLEVGTAMGMPSLTCSMAYRSVDNVMPLTVTAASTGLYRISTVIQYAYGTVGLRGFPDGKFRGILIVYHGRESLSKDLSLGPHRCAMGADPGPHPTSATGSQPSEVHAA